MHQFSRAAPILPFNVRNVLLHFVCKFVRQCSPRIMPLTGAILADDSKLTHRTFDTFYQNISTHFTTQSLFLLKSLICVKFVSRFLGKFLLALEIEFTYQYNVYEKVNLIGFHEHHHHQHPNNKTFK